jgi:hypothetical protein
MGISLSISVVTDRWSCSARCCSVVRDFAAHYQAIRSASAIQRELHELHHHRDGLSRGGVSQTGTRLRRPSRRPSNLSGMVAETSASRTQMASPTVIRNSTNSLRLRGRDASISKDAMCPANHGFARRPRAPVHRRRDLDGVTGHRITMRPRRAPEEISVCAPREGRKFMLVKSGTYVVPQEGFEPPTPSLRMMCSTD